MKLSANITDIRRDFIANGIRSFFRDESTFLLDVKTEQTAVGAALTVFNVMVIVIGAISLTLSFFLLLVSTTSNIRENVWEYGCLRAMGLTQA